MKKLITILIAILFTGALFGQYASQGYRYPWQFGMGAPGTVTGGVIYLRGLTSGRVQIKVPDVAGASTLFQFPGDNGSAGEALVTNGSGVLDYLKLIAPTDTATMLTPYINRADTAAMLAPYALTSEVGTGDLSASDTATMLTPYINRADTALMLAPYALSSEITVATGISAADTATMLSPYILDSEARNAINDSLDAYIAGAEVGLSLADSAVNAGGYHSYYDGVTGLALKVNLADSVNYVNGYMSRYDGVTGLAGKTASSDVRTITNDSINGIFDDERLVFAAVVGLGDRKSVV